MSVSNVLFHTAKNAVRRLSTEARLMRGHLITKEDAFNTHNIPLLKDVRIHFEDGACSNFKDHQFKAVLKAVYAYQDAQQKWYKEENLFDRSNNDYRLEIDLLDAEYQESLDQRIKDAFSLIHEESRKVKVIVELV